MAIRQETTVTAYIPIYTNSDGTISDTKQETDSTKTIKVDGYINNNTEMDRVIYFTTYYIERLTNGKVDENNIYFMTKTLYRRFPV